MAETRKRLTMVALARIDDLTGGEQFPEEVVDRIRVGYEAQLARIERRLAAIGSGEEVEDPAGSGGSDTNAVLQAELEARRLVIAAERAELDQLVARRKVTERVAGRVRTALDVDETTMRP